MANQPRLLSRREALTLLAAAGALGFTGYERDSVASKSGSQAPLGRPSGDGKEGRSSLKTIGVFGGLGPQATMDFVARVHRVAQRLIPPRWNSGYPPMLVSFLRHAPVLLNDDGSPRHPIQPDPRLFDAARKLGAAVDFIVIPSNTPHLFQAQIEKAAGCKVVSMIETTLDDVRRRGWRKVGVVGLGDPVVYTRPLGTMNIACETIDGELRGRLDASIIKVMEGRDDADSAATAREAIAALRAKQVEGIVIGCTEIPLLLGAAADQPDLVNPAQLLAEAAVKFAMA
jgi:aspartate racemase